MQQKIWRTGAAVLWVGVSTAGCASELESPDVAGASQAIIGGTETREFPEVALFRGVSAVNESLCSGTRIAEKFILTAGHCFREGQTDAGNAYAVFEPATDTQAAEAYLGRVSVLSHDAGDSDLAVVEILNPEDVNRVAGKVPLLKSGPLYDREDVTVVGWGCTSKEWNDELGTWDDGPGKGYKRVRHGQMASGSALRTPDYACGGDSGGPLFVGSGDALAAVVSYGYRNSNGDIGIAYADPIRHKGWIYDQITKLGGRNDVVEKAVPAIIREAEHEVSVIVRP